MYNRYRAMIYLRLYTLRLGVWEELIGNGLRAGLKLVVNVRTILPISPLLPTGRKAWQSWIGICSECQKDNCTCSTLQYLNILISTLLLTFRWRNVNQISAFECKIVFATCSSGAMHCLARREGLPLLILLEEMESSASGPSVLRNFNPGIFGTGFLQNPGIPGFSGTGLT